MTLHVPSTARAAALALALATLTGACGGGPPSVPVPARAAPDLTGDHVRDLARILQLEDARTFDAAAFDRLLSGTPPVELRRRAATAMGRIGDPAAIPVIAGLLADDRDPAVRADAAFALGELAERGEDGSAVVDALLEAVPSGWVPVRDEEAEVAVELLSALGKVGTRRAGRAVVDALREVHPARTERTARVAAAALLASWRVEGDGPTRRLAIARYLDSPQPALRWRAAYALSRGGAAAALPELLPHAQDPEHRVRAYVVRALSADRADSVALRDSALIVLEAALRDRGIPLETNDLEAFYDERDAPTTDLDVREEFDAERFREDAARVAGD